MEKKGLSRPGFMAAWISLISNILLTILKLITGLLFKSTALIADGVHNGGDVIASAATLSSMKVAHQPADREHPYGHGKAEDLASGFVSIVLLLAGLFLIYESVSALFTPAEEVSLWSFWAAVVSLVWKQLLYIYTKKVSESQRSKSLLATAYDHLADVWASLAAAIGIGVAWLGDIYHIPFAIYGDPAAGIIVSLLVIKIAFEMGITSVNVLMESSVSEEKKDEYRKIILSHPEVKRIDRLRAREHGNYILIDIRLSVSGRMTIQQGHDVSRTIRNEIKKSYQDVEEVLIHLNPWYADGDGEKPPADKA